MKEFKKKLIRSLLAVEIICFGGNFFFGAQGFNYIGTMQRELQETEVCVSHLQQEIAHLDADLKAWHSHAFYKEKVAREQLQMADVNDLIYFIG